MVAKKRNPQTIVLDSSQSEVPEEADTSSQEGSTTFVQPDDIDTGVCTLCGEPFAWHDAECIPAAAPKEVDEAPEPEEVAGASLNLTPAPFIYSIGQPVLPAPDDQPHTIIWRGQVKVRHSHTGLVHRVNVYRLNDGYWDCYYEGELQAA